MYVTKCKRGDNWNTGELVPYGNISISPASTVLNYGQGLFEGMKAYKTDGGRILLFRPEKNAERAAKGCLRLSMPEIPKNVFMDAVKKIVNDNSDYIPPTEKGALYIRPIIFGSAEGLGVAPSTEYTFIIYCSPVGPYFKGGLSPIKLIVSTDYHRAPLKGTGGVKAIGNYVPGMLPSGNAKKMGFAEIIYLDAAEEKYVEEVGAANFFAIKDGNIITPELTGSILPGITRDSVIRIAKEKLGMNIEERRISIDEVMEADEVFCAGTAAIISPIGSIKYNNKEHIFSNGDVGNITRKLYDILTGIQFGTDSDPFDWILEL
jgi:branched-chain amino acid aminotransferase